MSGIEMAIKKAESALQQAIQDKQNAHAEPTHEWVLRMTRREQALLGALRLLLDEAKKHQVQLEDIERADAALREWERDDLQDWELAGNALSDALRLFLEKAAK